MKCLICLATWIWPCSVSFFFVLSALRKRAPKEARVFFGRFYKRPGSLKIHSFFVSGPDCFRSSAIFGRKKRRNIGSLRAAQTQRRMGTSSNNKQSSTYVHSDQSRFISKFYCCAQRAKSLGATPRTRASQTRPNLPLSALTLSKWGVRAQSRFGTFVFFLFWAFSSI